MCTFETMKLLIDILGWVGSFVLVLAYALLSSGKMKAESPWYQGMNIVGSLFLIINTVYYGAFPSTAVNVVWIFIGFYSIGRAKIQKAENQ